MVITDLNQLNSVLAEALDNTTEKLLNELIDIVQKKVYGRGEPQWYIRTNQFGESWKFEASKIMGDVVQSAIFQDNDVMIHNKPLFQHGNKFEALKDGALSDILNDGTTNAGFGFSPVEATHFWDEFEEYVEHNLGLVFQEECRKLQLDINYVLQMKVK